MAPPLGLLLPLHLIHLHLYYFIVRPPNSIRQSSSSSPAFLGLFYCALAPKSGRLDRPNMAMREYSFEHCQTHHPKDLSGFSHLRKILLGSAAILLPLTRSVPARNSHSVMAPTFGSQRPKKYQSNQQMLFNHFAKQHYQVVLWANPFNHATQIKVNHLICQLVDHIYISAKASHLRRKKLMILANHCLFHSTPTSESYSLEFQAK